MSEQIAVAMVPSRRIGRSIAALLAGFVVNLLLSGVTDVGLHIAGILPTLGQAMNDSQCALAAAYRTLYSIFSSYVVARLAPNRPMQHALLGAAIGMVLATIGTVVTWNQNLGPHWYSLVLIVLALPSGWLGGKLRLLQMH